MCLTLLSSISNWLSRSYTLRTLLPSLYFTVHHAEMHYTALDSSPVEHRYRQPYPNFSCLWLELTRSLPGLTVQSSIFERKQAFTGSVNSPPLSQDYCPGWQNLTLLCERVSQSCGYHLSLFTCLLPPGGLSRQARSNMSFLKLTFSLFKDSELQPLRLKHHVLSTVAQFNESWQTC